MIDKNPIELMGFFAAKTRNLKISCENLTILAKISQKL